MSNDLRYERVSDEPIRSVIRLGAVHAVGFDSALASFGSIFFFF